MVDSPVDLTDCVFVSGTTFQAVDQASATLAAAAAVERKRQLEGTSCHSITPAAPSPQEESDYELYTEPEPEDEEELDTTQAEVFEELFGLKRKSGTSKGGPLLVSSKKSKKAGASEPKVPTGPIMSVKQMLDVGLFQPGLQNVVINVKKQPFVASLSPEGDFLYNGKVFKTPNQFAIHIKKSQGHNRPGGNGWKSIYVDGTVLEEWWNLMPPAVVAATAGGAEVPSADEPKPEPKPEPKAEPAPAATPPPAPASAPPPPQPPAASSNPSILRTRRVAAEAETAAVAAAAAGPNNWVQCSSCSQWRLVPAHHWPKIAESDEQDWYCKWAGWDVTEFEPFTPKCED